MSGYLQRLYERATAPPAPGLPGMHPAMPSRSPVAEADQRLNDPALAAVLIGRPPPRVAPEEQAAFDAEIVPEPFTAPMEESPLPPCRAASRPLSQTWPDPHAGLPAQSEPLSVGAPRATPRPREPQLPPAKPPEASEPKPSMTSPETARRERPRPADDPSTSPPPARKVSAEPRQTREPAPSPAMPKEHEMPLRRPPPRPHEPENAPALRRSAPPTISPQPLETAPAVGLVEPLPHTPAPARLVPAPLPAPPAIVDEPAPAVPSAAPRSEAKRAETVITPPAAAPEAPRVKRPATAEAASRIGPLAPRRRAHLIFGLRRR